MTPTPLPDALYPSQALLRLTDEVDRLSGKIDRLAETMATKSDLARYAPREMVETRWEEFERRVGDLQTHVDRHDAQLSGLLHDSLTREVRWDWRVIGGLGCILTFIFTLLGTILSGTVVGVTVFLITHR